MKNGNVYVKTGIPEAIINLICPINSVRNGTILKYTKRIRCHSIIIYRKSYTNKIAIVNCL